MSFLYKIIGRPFLKKYFEEQNRPLGFDDLEFAFALDHKGKVKRYYQFPKRKEMPISRMGQLEKYSMYMAAGLTGKNINDLLDQMEKAMTNAIENKKSEQVMINHLSTCMAIISEMRFRSDRVIPDEILYNYLAVQYVREDEKVDVFSNEIQMQKVEAFKESATANHRFFFQLPGLSEHLKVLHISEENWKDYIEASETQKVVMQSMMESFQYRNKSLNLKKTEGT